MTWRSVYSTQCTVNRKNNLAPRQNIKIRHLLLSWFLILGSCICHAQGVAINNTNAAPDASAMLDVQSTEKGILIPRMDSLQRTMIASPATGLLVFETTCGCFQFYNGSAWIALREGAMDHLADADEDTKIQVEESADEDIIRFDIAGTEYWRMHAGRIQVSNTGNSVLIGHEAGLNEDFSNNNANVFIGNLAGRLNTTGSDNVGIGPSALRINTTGAFNVAIGEQTLRYNTTGSNNVAIGENANEDNTTGSHNIALGRFSLNTNTTGNQNIAIGDDAGRNNSTGISNIYLGQDAGRNTTHGDYNTFIGRDAGNKNRSGDFNTIIGDEAGIDMDTALSLNIVLGREAGHSLQGSNNILLGYRAGYDAGTGNVMIGHQAGRFESSNDKLYIETSPTSTPLIWGDFDNDSVKIYGTLGVGDAFRFPISDGTNGQVLQTDGLGNISWAGQTADTDDQTLSISNDTLIIADGNAVSLAAYLDDTDTDDQTLSISNDTLSIADGNFVVIPAENELTDNDKDTKIQVEESADEDKIRFDVDGYEAMVIDSIGRIGIGTNSPGTLMDIKSQTGNAVVQLRPASGGLSRMYFRNDANQLYWNIGLNTTNAFTFHDPQTLATPFKIEHGAGLFTLVVDSLSRVGIGTHVPEEKLQVMGSIRMVDSNQQNGYIMMSDALGTGSWQKPNDTTLVDNDGDTKIQVEESPDEDYIRFDVGGTEAMVIENTGQVGIGTHNPVNTLDIHSTSGNAVIALRPGGSGVPRIYFKDSSNVVRWNIGLNTKESFAYYDAVTATTPFKIEKGAGTNTLVVDTLSRVGIGTNFPTEKLHVIGNIRMLDGNEQNGYIMVSDTGGTASWQDASMVFTDTDDQTLSLSNDTLIIADGNSVSLASYLDNTDDQTLNLSNDTLSIADGNFVILPIDDEIADTDGDTKIQVEENADEDVIRFDAAGTEQLTISNTDITNYDDVNIVSPLGAELNLTNTTTNHTWQVVSGYGEGLEFGHVNSGQIDGSSIMYLHRFGRVGIGTVTPDEELDVNGSIRMTDGNQQNGYIMVSDANGTASWQAYNDTALIDNDGDTKIQVEESPDEDIIRFDVGGTEAMVIDSTGHVGIGFSNPGNLLDLRADNDEEAIIRLRQRGTISQYAGFRIDRNAGQRWFIGINDLDNDLIFRSTGSDDRMTLTTAGNLGIGIGTPSFMLSLNGNSDRTIGVDRTSVDHGHDLTVQAGGAASGYTDGGGGDLILSGGIATGDNLISLGNHGSNIIFKTASPAGASSNTDRTPNERMRITYDGEVGINETDPQSILDVKDRQSGTGNYIVRIENTRDNNSSQNDGLLIKAGHSTYSAGNQSSFIFFESPDGDFCGRIRQIGNNTVAYTAISDIRLKENIRPTRYGLEDLLRIEVSDYNYISDDASTMHTGFLAQQLHTVYPGPVDVGGEDPKTESWGVDYSQLTPLLVKAIQDQQEIIEALQSEIDNKDEDIQALQQKIADIEELILGLAEGK